ncbi:ABC transporter ATP-binding protein [Lachnotalea glycerini]|nr:ABC transporter ATP-binding protein [Lachnotalea glycerini]
MGILVDAQSICKDYGNFALKDISFKIESGNITGFLGRNGAGKTTTIKSLLNLITIDKGTIKLFSESASIDFSKIGVVFEECNYFNNFTVKEIEIMQKKICKNWDQNLFAEMTTQFNLERNLQASKLSQGMKKLLCLSVVMSSKPSLLILDELSSGLDPNMRVETLQILRDFVKIPEHAILFSTHIMEDVVKIADQIIIVKNGSIVLDESKEQLLLREAKNEHINEIEKLEKIFFQYTDSSYKR